METGDDALSKKQKKKKKKKHKHKDKHKERDKLLGGVPMETDRRGSGDHVAMTSEQHQALVDRPVFDSPPMLFDARVLQRQKSEHLYAPAPTTSGTTSGKTDTPEVSPEYHPLSTDVVTEMMDDDSDISDI